MRLGMIGLGKMGLNMSRRLVSFGHEVYAYDTSSQTRQLANDYNIKVFADLSTMINALGEQKIVWLMLPENIVSDMCESLISKLNKGDIVIDGGNCHFEQSIKRFNQFASYNIEFIDVGVSGGVFGLERGYCLMVGGNKKTYEFLTPIFQSLSPNSVVSKTLSRKNCNNDAESGFLYCGKSGAGHYVKMIHNAIEYGMMQAFAEGFEMLVNAKKEHLPPQQQYDFCTKDIAELWRKGSVVSSWLLDLISNALHKDEKLENFSGSVADSGEGRWALIEAIKQNTPVSVIANSLFVRFASRQDNSPACKMLSALRNEFGGHLEKKVE